MLFRSIVETLEIRVTETDGVAKLAQLHPVEDAAAHITRPLEGVFSPAQHGDGLLAGLERLHQHLELFVPQQIATYGGGIQVRNVEIDEGIVNLLGRGSADVLRLGPFERRIDLTQELAR